MVMEQKEKIMASDDIESIRTIYPDISHPYYIVAPPYVRTSAGVRVLHLLCHSLNRLGKTAYLIIYPAMPWQQKTLPDLLTPLLTHDIITYHKEKNLTPIMIYPETIAGNPFKGSCIVRYVLNFPGLLGGDKEYASDELCFSYSKILAEKTHYPDNILFLPATDTRIFYPSPINQSRSGSCYFASKYNGELLDITKNSIEIKRHVPGSQTTEQVADLFRHSKIFYTYENTALAIEAVLCGCPTVFLPTSQLTEIIAIKELGTDGYAWGIDPAEISRAAATVAQGAKNYKKSYSIYWQDLEKFIIQTQQDANKSLNKNTVRLPNFFNTVFCIVKQHGVFGVINLMIRKLQKMMGKS